MFFLKRTKRYDIAVRYATHSFRIHIPDKVRPPETADIENDCAIYQAHFLGYGNQGEQKADKRPRKVEDVGDNLHFTSGAKTTSSLILSGSSKKTA